MRSFFAVGAVIVSASLIGIGSPQAQEDLWVPDLPLTRNTGVSARALGMGGAYLAISDDGAALRHNPAGLTRIRRIEFAGSFIDRAIDMKTTDHGSQGIAEMTKMRIAGLSFVYPFPTYRGSMVMGLGYHVPHILDRNYVRAGETSEGWREEELFDEGTVGEWSFGLAIDFTPEVSLGFRLTRIYGSRFRDWRFENAEVTPAWHETNDLTVSGYTASGGALIQILPTTQLGLVLDLPRWLHNEVETTYEDGSIGVAEDDMTLPFSLGAGVASHLKNLLLTADVRMTDWTQIDYEGPMRYVDESGQRQQAYRRTWDIHVGAEYLLDLSDELPLRLRAGFAMEPVPYEAVFEDIDFPSPEDEGVPVYSEGTFDPNRRYFTFGAGTLLAQSMTIDIAYATGTFTREGGTLVEKEDERRVMMTAGFRLQ